MGILDTGLRIYMYRDEEHVDYRSNREPMIDDNFRVHRRQRVGVWTEHYRVREGRVRQWALQLRETKVSAIQSNDTTGG